MPNSSEKRSPPHPGNCGNAIVAAREDSPTSQITTESCLQRFLSTYPEGFICVGADGTILAGNLGINRLLGYSENEITTLSMSTLLKDFTSSGLEGALQGTHPGEPGLYWFQSIALKKDGSVVPVEILVSETAHPPNCPPRYGLFIRDLSARLNDDVQRREFEGRLHQQNRLTSLRGMAAGVAHDFNNLLMVILGNVDFLKEGLADNPNQQQCLLAIERAARRASSLSHQMLTFAGGAATVRQTIDLSQLIRDLFPILEILTDGKSVVDLAEGAKSSAIDGDPDLLRQMIVSLTQNACESLREVGGRIFFQISDETCDADFLSDFFLGERLSPGPFVLFRIEDNGCGMDEEMVKRVFDPYYSSKFAGRGLGMAAVFGIIDRHGGAIRVRSSPSKGTTIEILFPVSNVAAKIAPSVSIVRPKQFSLGTVLLAEDEPEIMNLEVQMLNKMGMKVITATDGEEALNGFRSRGGEIDLLLLDLAMPRLTGIQVAREIRKLDQTIPIILCSGYHRGEAFLDSMGIQETGFLQKPFSFTELKKLLWQTFIQGSGGRVFTVR